MPRPGFAPGRWKVELGCLVAALLGCALIALSTQRWGLGLSHDSTEYIRAARAILASEDVDMVSWPPLYPLALAATGALLNADPLQVANVLNALLFGCVIYSAGRLTVKYVGKMPLPLYLMLILTLFGIPLLLVGLMAWSETLFIFLSLWALASLERYLAEGSVRALLLTALAVALSVLTRYIGFALLPWGALMILDANRDRVGKGVGHAAAFLAISMAPISIWLARNYLLLGAWFGPRVPSEQGLSDNLGLVFGGVLKWYVPWRIGNPSFGYTSLGAVCGLLMGVHIKTWWPRLKEDLLASVSLVLFAALYLALLVVTASTTTYDTLNDRLLSPLYVPITMLLIMLARRALGPYVRTASSRAARLLLGAVVVIWLGVLVRTTADATITFARNGGGYASSAWRSSETVEWVRQQIDGSEARIYTNGPDVLYILTDMAGEMSPLRQPLDEPELDDPLAALAGHWPEEEAYLVWFGRIGRQYLFDVEDLMQVSNVELIARLNDGAVYRVTRW